MAVKRRRLQATVERGSREWHERREGTSVHDDDLWSRFVQVVKNGAQQVIGRSSGIFRNRETWWWGEKVKEAIEKKRKCFKAWRRSKGTEDEVERRAEYVEAKREAKKEVLLEKQAF